MWRPSSPTWVNRLKKVPYDEIVRPDRWLPKGEAYADRNRRKPLVVWSGIPGEEAVVVVVHEGRNQDVALFKEARHPDRHRVDPPCERYTLCGGCPLMHLDAQGQRDARWALVRGALDYGGHRDVPIGTWHPSPEGLQEYRHVVKLGFGYSDRGHVRVGAWGRRDRRIVPIPRCNVAIPVLRSTMVALAHHTIDLGLRPYAPETDEGVLRAAVLRASATTGEVLITLVAGRRTRELRELAERVAGQVSAVVGVWLHLNTEPGNALFIRDEGGTVPVLPLLGKDSIEETLGSVTYSIGPGDFFQTHPSIAAELYERVLDRVQADPAVPLVDLYSGVGGIALQAAARGRWALGVEGVEGAVTRAREASRRQGLDAEFLCGQVEEVLPGLARRLEGRQPVVVVDPARRGLEPGVIEGILALRPREVAYVSCNPRALAHDLVAFRDAGLKPAEVELFDMFPNTAHVEALVTLRAEGAAPPRGRAPRRKVVR